eukprot:1288263-Rhodomonas_salina.1
MMVTVAALFYFMSLRPYTSKAVDNMQSISLLTQAATLFCECNVRSAACCSERDLSLRLELASHSRL